MKFDEVTTAVAFLILVAIAIGGTLTSGMPQTISMMVSGGVIVFSILVLALGVKHGEYRAMR